MILKKDITKFINTIHETSHKIIDRFGGYISSNEEGGSFFIFKFSENDIFKNSNKIVITPSFTSYLSADLSLITMIKIIGKIFYDEYFIF